MTAPTRAIVGGIIGPIAFIAAWAIGGLVRKGYSPRHDAISRLAEIGATTRPLMTAGFVIFAIGVGVFAIGARHTLPGWSWLALLATAAATLGVAAFPLGGPAGDITHGAFATAGYVTLAAAPLLAAPSLIARGARTVGIVSLLTGVAITALLAMTAVAPDHGLTQRLGLAVGDTWIVLAAVATRTRWRSVANP